MEGEGEKDFFTSLDPRSPWMSFEEILWIEEEEEEEERNGKWEIGFEKNGK